MTHAPSYGSDQPGNMPNLIMLCFLWVARDPLLLHADSEDSVQTGYTSHFVDFVVLHLICKILQLAILAHERLNHCKETKMNANS